MNIPNTSRYVLPLVLWAACSCAATAPEESPSPQAPSAPRANDFWANSMHIVEGTVVDGSGTPLKAKVALVSPNGRGSSSTGTHDGKFRLGASRDFPMTLTAWTPDGRIAWRVLDAPPGDTSLRLVDKGAFLTLVAGDYDDRVSILQDGVPINDVKFPSGEERTFVVPAGQISFGTTGGSQHLADRRTAQLVAGERLTVTF